MVHRMKKYEEQRCSNRFFKPFEGLNANFSQAPEGRIIAINEGRLMDFFEGSPEHKFLYDAIDEYFIKVESPNFLMA